MTSISKLPRLVGVGDGEETRRNAGGQKASSAPGKCVLVVEECSTIATLVKEMLARDSHEVVVAHSGTEALEELSSREFDVIFLSDKAGDMDGTKVLQIYRFGTLHAAPTFFLTSDPAPETDAALRSAGAAGILCNPISPDVLRQAIAAACPPDSDAPGKLPGSAPQDPPAVPPAGSRSLSTVPPQYLDLEVLDAIRSVSDRPAFFSDVMAAAIIDIERTTGALTRALADQDAECVRDAAYALKGVCVSVGAKRLVALANRALRESAAPSPLFAVRLKADVAETSRESVKVMRDTLAELV